MRRRRSIIAAAALVALAACGNVDTLPVAAAPPSAEGITVNVSAFFPNNADLAGP